MSWFRKKKVDRDPILKVPLRGEEKPPRQFNRFYGDLLIGENFDSESQLIGPGGGGGSPGFTSRFESSSNTAHFFKQKFSEDIGRLRKKLETPGLEDRESQVIRGQILYAKACLKLWDTQEKNTRGTEDLSDEGVY